MDRSTHPIQRLSPEQADLGAVLALARAAEDADGDPPLSDQTLVDLRTEPERVHLAQAAEDGRVLAAAVLVEPRERDAPALLEGVVDVRQRGRGLGRRLLETILEDHDGPVDAWSHGDHPAARHLAQTLGFEPVRELHRLLRPDALPERLPEVELPEGAVIRSFEPGRDEQELLRVNAAAFADHPEQGRMSLEDLRQRQAEPWFDPAGLLLAVEQDEPDRVLGFHWTKRHPASAQEPARGEVYVVGIAPDQQGRRLGRALTIAGMRHLAEQGLDQILLYVDAENTAAFRLYESLGFERWHVDVMFSRR